MKVPVPTRVITRGNYPTGNPTQCTHLALTPSPTNFICHPISTVDKKPAVTYNTVTISDSPDMAITCPSEEISKGVYNSGCPVNHTHNTPSWWRCHIYHRIFKKCKIKCTMKYVCPISELNKK